MTNDFDSWLEEYESVFRVISWTIVQTLFIIGIIFLILLTIMLFQNVYGYDFVICLHEPSNTNITYPENTVCDIDKIESEHEEPLESTQKEGWKEDDE